MSLDYSTSLSSLAPSSINQSSLDTPNSTSEGDTDIKFDAGSCRDKKESRRLSLQVRALWTMEYQPRVYLVAALPTFPPDQSVNPVLSDYADITHTAMYNSSQDDDRPTNRFYRFLTRSRSRSRTKNSSNTSHDPVTTAPSELACDFDPKLPHSRDSSWSSRGRSSKRSSSKPSTILPSRPLSSTTTATNTTITPSTPKAKRHIVSPAVPEEASSSAAGPSQENTHLPAVVSRPATPKQSSGTRKKLRNIFGIPSRKSSISSSRGTSPGRSNTAIPSTDIPPVPPHPHAPSHDVPRTQSPDPASSSRPHSPSPVPNDPLTSSVSSATSSSSRFDHFAKLFSHPNSSRSRPNVSGTGISKPRRSSTASLSTPPSSTDSISGPTKHKRASTDGHHHRGVHVYAPQPTKNAALKETSDGNRNGSNGHAILGTIPRIAHTPPTPNRSATTPPRMSHRNESMDSSYRHRPLLIVDEEKERESSIGDSTKGKARESNQGNATTPKRRGSDASDSRAGSRAKPSLGTRTGKQVNIRATKHGSFDFEKPTWNTGGMMSRSISGNSGSRHNQSGESLGSVGSATAKSKVYTPDSDRKKTANGTPTVTFDAHKRPRQRTPPSKTVPLHSEDTSHRSPTGKGHSSSLGKSAGKRTLGVGVTRLVGLAHGPFSFEPAVPSPTNSHTSASTAGGELHTERDAWRIGHGKEGGLLRSMSTRSKVSQAEPPLPSGTPSTRSAARGRSLDLGLGLSWAPSKVREETLLPTGAFASGKTSSASSRRGLARHEEEDERTRVGQEVAEVFKKVLDEDAFVAFKHYVHQFDAHEIPFDGPNGIIARAERLLGKASNLGHEEQQALLSRLIRVILHNA
ncbi:hypothetical protein VNI00_001206 [Paramarasmius palmivorus]|uniref:Uncharacterized protein n=1 Tax=Paramarasmius palmivorus TaxID=297713 RepID=A0AAW0E9W1_9AGAR